MVDKPLVADSVRLISHDPEQLFVAEKRVPGDML